MTATAECREDRGGRTCDLCGRSLTETIRLNGEFRAFLCRGCDLLITDAGHGREDVERINREFYPVESMILTYYPRRKEFRRKYRDAVSMVRRHLDAAGRISALEIGSNIGFFTSFLRQEGVDVASVEINPTMREFQKVVYGIDAVPDIESIGGARTFDAVFLMDVLEHIPRPASFLGRIVPLLRKGGVVFLQCPNKNSLSARLFQRRWHWWSAPDHLYHFSERAIRVMAGTAGLGVRRLREVSPLVDELANIPLVGPLFSPLQLANRVVPVNRFVAFRGGMLLQAVLVK